jgi:hypothetical protein
MKNIEAIARFAGVSIPQAMAVFNALDSVSTTCEQSITEALHSETEEHGTGYAVFPFFMHDYPDHGKIPPALCRGEKA